MRSKKLSTGWTAMLVIFGVALLVTPARAVAQEKLLHSFSKTAEDGGFPGGVIFDASGNLYGTTYLGGKYRSGTVFELIRTGDVGWTQKVLYDFTNGGAVPYVNGSLTFDASGNLYGTTEKGGAYGGGMVFELIPAAGRSWTEKTLHNFGRTGQDVGSLFGGVILDAAGNLYGTTEKGGAYGFGTVFELTHTAKGSWAEKILYSFNFDGKDGSFPNGDLIFDAAGNLYGTTGLGGSSNYGTVFELTPTGAGWSEKILYNFSNLSGKGGYYPNGGVILDGAGNLYGTNSAGGDFYGGTVFELTPTGGGGWTLIPLHNFGQGGEDGFYANGGLIFDSAGNLYGTTNGGGIFGYYGTVFELTPNAGGGWTEKTLHSFNNNGTDGFYPNGGLIFDAVGHLYGTTYQGGSFLYGTVFEIVR